MVLHFDDNHLHCGVENNELQWFISYMPNRQQYVDIENTKSTT